MIRQVVDEKYDNDGYFDHFYIVFVGVAVLPTFLVPWLYTHWDLLGSTSSIGALLWGKKRESAKRTSLHESEGHRNRNSNKGRDPRGRAGQERRFVGREACCGGNNGGNVAMGFENKMSIHYQYGEVHNGRRRSSGNNLLAAEAGMAPKKRKSVSNGGEKAHLALEQIQCFNQHPSPHAPGHQARVRGSNRENGEKERRARSRDAPKLSLNAQYLEPQQLAGQSGGPGLLQVGVQDAPRRQSYCPGYHFGGSSAEARRPSCEERRHSCLPQHLPQPHAVKTKAGRAKKNGGAYAVYDEPELNNSGSDGPLAF